MGQKEKPYKIIGHRFWHFVPFTKQFWGAQYFFDPQPCWKGKQKTCCFGSYKAKT